MSDLRYSITCNVTDRTVSTVGPGNFRVNSNGISLFQQDEIELRLFFVRREATGALGSSVSTTRLSPTGWEVVAKIGGTGGDVLASQDTWTVVNGGDDGYYLQGLLSLNTAGTAAVMADGTDIVRFLEIEVDDGTSNYTAAQTRINIKPEIITDGSPDAVAVPEIYTPIAYGAQGDGTTDDTAAFAAVCAAAPLKSQIYVPSGTYILDGLEIGRDVGFLLHPNAVLKHKADASGDMISYTVPCSTPIEGGTFDGNKENQSEEDNFFALLATNCDGATIRDCAFQGFMKAGVLDFDSLGDLTVDNCKFLNGHTCTDDPDLSSKTNAGLVFAPGHVGGSPHVRVTGCLFQQDSAPEAGFQNPGGFYIAGSDANSSFNSLILTHNKFKGVGGANASTGVGVAAIDIYEDTKNCFVAFNIVEDCDYVAFKMQNVQNLECIGNIAKNCSTVTSVFLYTPGERSQEAEYKTAKIIGNTVETAAGAVAFAIAAGDSGGWHEVIFANNPSRDTLLGLTVDGSDAGGNNEGYGPVLVSGNQFWVTGNNGIRVNDTQATLIFTDNYVEVTTGNCFVATTGNVASRFSFRGNVFKTDTAAYTGVRIWGVAEVSFSGNRFDRVTEAVELKQDGSANLIGRLQWDNNNVIVSGSVDITVADISAGYIHSGNSFRSLVNSASASSNWTKADGTTRIFNIDQANGCAVAGNGTLVGGYAFLAAVDGSGNQNHILARNPTAGGMANISVSADTCIGGVRAWSSTFGTAYLADKIGLYADTTALAAIIAAPTSGQTVDVYAGSTNLTAQFDGDATAGNTRFLLFDVTAGALKRVSIGAADSGGSGFKVLRVAN